jgi:hypothetical protein
MAQEATLGDPEAEFKKHPWKSDAEAEWRTWT